MMQATAAMTVSTALSSACRSSRGGSLEDVLGDRLRLADRLAADHRPADADADAGEAVDPEAVDDRLQPLLAAVAAAGPDADGADGEVEAVADDEQSLRRHAIAPGQGGNRVAAVIDIGARLHQDRRPALDHALAQGGERSVRLERHGVAARQTVDAPEADVVPVVGVVSAVVSQADDEPHGFGGRLEGDVRERALGRFPLTAAEEGGAQTGSHGRDSV